MSVGTLIDIYTTDASPSWNGYNYQGKVGIYVALNLLKTIESNEIKSYELELEWFEDFCIKKDGEYISIHQVKTYSASGAAKYKEAIWLLLAKLLDTKEINNAYLHVSKEISNVSNLKQNIKDYTMPEVSEKKIKDEKNNYASPAECYKKVIDSGEYDNLFEKLKLYKYHDNNNYSSFTGIENLIKECIKEIVTGECTQRRIDTTYYYLLGLVDENIRSRHEDIQAGKKDVKVAINFSQIKAVLDKNYDSLSLEAAIFQLRNKFYEISSEYLEDLLDDIKDGFASEEEKLAFELAVLEINKLDNNEFMDFCLKISPNSTVNKEVPEHLERMLMFCLEKSGLNNSFFEIIKSIKKEIHKKQWIYNAKDNKGINKSYLPSTIIDDDNSRRNLRLANDILKNPHPDLLHEVDKIVTKHINLESLDNSKINSNIPEIEANTTDSDEYMNILKIKKISLIDIKNAKGELENERNT